MSPRYFTFPDQATAEAVILPHVDGVDSAADLPRVGRMLGIDYEMIGRLRFPAVVNDQGQIVEAERVAAGFHVNMLVPIGIELPEELDAYEVFPATPMRRFG
ncbi:MAG: hypothetical protein RIE16_06830 [Rhodospirillales bacterium]